jgi:hypothetical protein
MRSSEWIVVPAAGAIAAAGLLGGSPPAAPPEQPPPSCRVTIPNGSTPPGETPTPDRHGNGRLWASVNRTGRFTVAPPESRPMVDGVLAPDGSVGIKAPWWRGPGVRGRVRVRAVRLDGSAPRVDRTVPPSGYGLTGFQAMGLTLPTTGCWKVTGSVGEARLTFVTLVRRLDPVRE